MKRRDFMKLSTAMGAAVVLSNARSAFAAPANDRVNLGVIGCGSRSDWVCPEPKVRTGYLARYAKLVSSADRGAILDS